MSAITARPWLVMGVYAAVALVGLALLLVVLYRWSDRRAAREARAEVLPPPWPPLRPQPASWTPATARPRSLADVQGRRPGGLDAATVIIPRVSDTPDATAIIPAIRKAR